MANANESATQSQINELVADIGQKLSATLPRRRTRRSGSRARSVAASTWRAAS